MKATELKCDYAIGGSEVAAALGLSPYVSPYRLWQRKKGLIPDEPDTLRLRAGRIAERYISELIQLSPQHEQYQIEIGSARGTIDAIMDGVIYEFKTTGQLWPEEPPIYYQLQVIWYAGLYELTFNHPPAGVKIIAIDGRFNIREYQIDYNSDYFGIIDSKIGEWIEKYLLGENEPKKGVNELSEVVPNSTYLEIKDEKILTVYEDLLNIKEKIAELEEKKTSLENAIKAAIGENEGCYINGNKITWKSQSRQTLDTKGIERDYPEIFKKYLKTSTYRVFRY